MLTLNIFTHFSSVFIVDFEQVNVSWELSSKQFKSIHFQNETKGCIPYILFGPFLNTLFHILLPFILDTVIEVVLEHVISKKYILL